ncbi:hypothetical protein GCM10010435_27800 [Winogradskya consettensis]|uniref:HEAT repeat protein n=1 Tax=Winogradskya consettensis TaxID=113560 RepID=A0A919SI31_9ACTN|nr:hypothetical protein Aco04nite_23700 [Actinoplanes consettensis]
MSGQVREAVRRGDLVWLSAHLGVPECTPAVLKLLVRHDDPRLRHWGLERLAARIATSRVEESERAELAGFLPQQLDGPPETALVLAHIHQVLWRHVPQQRRPQWRAAGLPARVQIAWLRAELLNQPESVRTEPVGELLYQAVAGLTAADAAHPDDLVRELAASSDQVMRDAALRLAREGLHAALLAPARAREHIGRLLDSPHAGVAVAALRELAEPWAAFAPFPRERLMPFLRATEPAVDLAGIDAAVTVAARHGHGDLLRDIVVDDAVPPRSRQTALQVLGETAARDDIPAVLAIAATDPLLYGRSAIACLRSMHRRGLFPSGDDAALIVDLALADHSITAAEAATIMFTCRHEAFRALVVDDAADVTWPRRLELLVGLARQGSGDLPAGETVTRLLPAASRPEPFLAAIRALRHLPAEAAVIDVLPRSPAAALDALEAIGGRLTVAALEDGLGTVIAPHLRTVRNRALELLWHLTDDPDRRRTILARLNPRDLPRRIATDLGAADRGELAVLSAGFDPASPAEALIALARNGDAATLETIAELLLRIVADLAASDEPGDPDEVVSAIQALGARLHQRGKLRPFCLREAGTAKEAGHALVATIVLDLLDRPGLSPGEQAVLLAMLQQAPYAGTRARVHRLLRHRDRHVRKQVIALLAADTTGDDAEALSASLIVLTAARDAQTVRQALLALGHVQAHWAAPAIAKCLGHPTMNVKKTAASVLVHTGTPAVVPELLFWLGNHDNPGLRATLIEALHAVLGDSCAATVLAAAEQAPDDRTRELLLDGLGCTLSARSVNALAEQGSPIAPALLTLIAAGRIRLGSGDVEDLAAQLTAYGITAPAGRDPAPGNRSDHDVDALALDGWDTEIARRVMDHPLSAGQLTRLRPMLADWLDLAEVAPAALRFALRICPAPWPAHEINAFTRAARTLVDGLAGATGDDRDDLLAVLEAVAPGLDAQALDIVTRIRALPPTAAGRRSTLPLLRRCGAVLTRADLEHALTAARLGPDPWLAEPALLRDAFAVTTTTSREHLNALIEAFPSTSQDERAALLDRMEALQPLDAPAWTITENTHLPTDVPRTPQDGDLDQPRSAAQRERLLTALDAPEADRRNAAAAALRDWPEPETTQAVLRAFLHGRAEVTITPGLAHALTTMDETELRAGDAVQERVARAAFHLDPAGLQRLLPLLLEWWEHGDPATQASAGRTLRQFPELADTIAESLRSRLDAGAWGLLDLIIGRSLLRTPALTETCRRLHAEGRDDLAEKIILVDGPLAGSKVAALQERPQADAVSREPSRPELITLIHTGHPDQIRRALTTLAETLEDTNAAQDPELEDLLAELLHHRESRIRLHAHRIGRKLLDRPTYLRHTAILLDDAEPDVVRSAISTVGHAAYEPAIPAVVGLLTHPHSTVRRTAADALVHIGPPAASALTYAARHARPDKRHHYSEVLNRITGPWSPDAEGARAP